MSFSSFVFPTRQLAGFRPHIIKQRFPPATSLLVQTRSRLYSSASRLSIGHATCTQAKEPIVPGLFKILGIAGIGIGISSFKPKVHCDAPLSPPSPNSHGSSIPLPPKSTVSLYELSFGTVAGICAGVFIKKGAKAVAWFLGGIFVLLQYLGSESLVRVDWGRMATRFENMFYRKDTSGMTRKPTVASLWSWLVDFLTADFQPRASFIAGLALGLRVG